MMIYISYSQKHRDYVEKIAADLKTLEYAFWYDQQLTGGQFWWDEVLAQIIRCDVYIIVLSADWLKENGCYRTFDFAHQLNKRILPILVAHDIDDDLLPTEIQELKIIDYTLADDESLESLKQALDHLPSEKPLPNPLPTPPPAPLSKLGGLQTQVRADVLTLDAQKSLVNDIKWYLYANDLRVVHHAQRLLREIAERTDAAKIIQDHIADLLHDTEEISTSRLEVPASVAEKEEIDKLLETNESVAEIKDNKRRLDVAIPSQMILHEESQLWVQLCMPNSFGFREHVGALTDQSIFAASYVEESPTIGRREHNKVSRIRIEVKGIGFSFSVSSVDLIVPFSYDAPAVIFTIKPQLLLKSAVIHIVAKRLVSGNKYVTIGTVALRSQVLAGDGKRFQRSNPKWTLRSLVFSTSILFDEQLKTWGLQQEILKDKPAPWNAETPLTVDLERTPVTLKRYPDHREITQIHRPERFANPQFQTPPTTLPHPPEKRQNQAQVQPPSRSWLLWGGVGVFMFIAGMLFVMIMNGGGGEVGSSERASTLDSMAFFDPTPTNTGVADLATPEDIPISDTHDEANASQSMLHEPDLRLRYTYDRMTLENISGGRVNVSDLVFATENGRFEAITWAEFTSTDLQRFPQQGCLHIVELGMINLPTCVRVNAYVVRAASSGELFWQDATSDQFLVLRQGETIAYCESAMLSENTIAEQTCEFSLVLAE